MASNITVDTLTKGSTTLNTDEIVDTNSNQIAKAWVNFNGTGTVAIRDSFNVASLTDNGTGDITLNFTTSLVDSNYSVIGSVANAAGAQVDTYNVRASGAQGSATTKTTSAVRLTSQTGSYDCVEVYTAIFGN